MTGAVAYGVDIISYEVRFLGSRQTLGIEVHPDSRVLVRAPVGCSEKLIAERIKKRAGWIRRQLQEFERYRPRTPPRQYVAGESHRYLGRQYRLKTLLGDSESVQLIRGLLVVTHTQQPTPQETRRLIRQWYLARAREIFSAALVASARRFKDIESPRLIVRHMNTRWGSLSMNGNMTLNVDLVKAPKSCIEYVITHELCHMKHRNHDDRFFGLLDGTMPDWRARKVRLEFTLL